MAIKTGLFVLLAVALAGVFVRLGFWQLNRLSERREVVAEMAARLSSPPAPFDQLPDSAAYRRAVVRGTPDYSREIVFAGRSLRGSPGVYVLTPLLRDTVPAAIVVRGWLYSPDAATVELERWREARDEFSGYVNVLPGASERHPLESGLLEPRRVRTLDHAAIQRLLPYRVDARYLVVQDSGGPGAPARLPPPALDDGPHLSYAIQWFTFAAIAVFGAGIVVARALRLKRAGATAA